MPSFNMGGARPAAALECFAFGLSVIPVAPGSKVTTEKWDPWLDDLSADKITQHWARHPEHDVGAILGDGLIVFDADSAQSIAALEALELKFNLVPKLVVRTRKGVHHYYRRAAGTFAKSDAHSTERHPERVDVKTGRALAVLPPSGGREVVLCEAESVDDLSEATQEFVDAVSAHNGREAPRPYVGPVAHAVEPPSSQRMAQVKALLERIDADLGYGDWTPALMAVHHESGGSDEGLEIAVEWSSRGKKFKGRAEIEAKWRSFKLDVASAHTIGTLIYLARKCGADTAEILDAAEPGFEPCDFEIAPAARAERPPQSQHPLARFSLLKRTGDVKRQFIAEKHVLGEIALSGQATVIYAAPNTGKTLITIALLTEKIRLGHIDPALLFYVNADDTGQGLLVKLQVADEFEFNVLAEGHRGFSVRSFFATVEALTASEHARGSILVLDTLKKFTTLMDKSATSRFTDLVRRFVMRGGTVIALAHTNKHPRPDGTPVYAGTSDVVDDFDCAYTVQQVVYDPDAKLKVVLFENLKRRGDVVQSAAYQYSIERGLPYDRLLLSVQQVDEAQLAPLVQAEALRSDAEMIAAVQACVREGVNTKMRLAHAVAERTNVSRAKALALIERYTGDDPTLHRWRFTVRQRGAKVFELLQQPNAADGQPPADHDF